MEFKLIIRKLTVDTATGTVLEQQDLPIGIASLEQVHAWLSSGDQRIWNASSPAPAVNS